MDFNTLEVSHQDGVLTYRLKKGGYLIQDGSLTISVETEATEEEQFPDCVLFCLERHPVTSPISAGSVFEASKSLDDEFDLLLEEPSPPFAHAYFTFHAEEVRLKFVAEEVSGDEVLFSLEAEHDDVNYYDQRAESTPTRGKFLLKASPQASLWIPV